MAKNIDWVAVKTEYITSNPKISYRELAKKYSIVFSTLEKTARKEKWSELRRKECDKIATKLRQKTAEKIIEVKTSRIERLLDLCDKTTEKLEKAIDQVEDENGEIDTNNLRRIVQSLKDVKEVIGEDDSMNNKQEESHNALVRAIRERNDNK